MMLQMIFGQEIKPSVYNKEVGLFTKGFHPGTKNVTIPFCDPKLVARTICETFNNTEGVRYNYDESKCFWEIEYGTTPLEYSVNNFILSQQILTSRWVFKIAAMEAVKKFPYLQDTLDINTNYNPFERLNKRWCKMTLQLFYDEKNNSIYIEPKHITQYSDYLTFNYLVDIIFNTLKSQEFVKSVNWSKRANYINFTEGIEYSPKNHILQYLCEDLAVKEICELLSYKM